MRKFFIVSCLANVAFAFGSLPWMPNPAAVHFTLDGTVDGFASPWEYAMLLSVVTGFMAAVILGVSWMMPIFPPYSFNMPNRDYWLNEENRPKTIRRICFSVELTGAGTMLLLLLIQWQVFQANQTVPPTMPNISVTMCAGIILGAVIVFDLVLLFWSFCLPKEKQLEGFETTN